MIVFCVVFLAQEDRISDTNNLLSNTKKPIEDSLNRIGHWGLQLAHTVVNWFQPIIVSHYDEMLFEHFLFDILEITKIGTFLTRKGVIECIMLLVCSAEQSLTVNDFACIPTRSLGENCA